MEGIVDLPKGFGVTVLIEQVADDLSPASSRNSSPRQAGHPRGSGLIGHSQKMTVAASAMAEKKTIGQRS